MLIIKMLKRITGYNQEDLAKYLGVSRASINQWDNSDDKMTTYQKNIISEKLGIPIKYFDDNITDDYEKCKELYQLMLVKWKLNAHNIDSIDYESQLLNSIEYDLNIDNVKHLSDQEVLDSLCNGINPYTGELYDDEHILNDENVHMFLLKVKNKYFKYGAQDITLDDLDSSQYSLFQELKRWRLDMTNKEGFFSAYMVFTDKELINIVTSNTHKKEDLLSVKGIGDIKYQKYGDDIFYILETKKYNFNV